MFCFLYALFFPHYSSSSSLSRLELLPDELLLEILSHVSISDLFYGWLNLNCRFNIILRHLLIKISYNEPKYSWWQQWWYSWWKSSNTVPLRYFASQLVSLQTHNCHSLSIVNKLDILDYPNLRMLTLRQPTAAQFQVIQEHNFRHLEYLSLVETRDFSFEILCQFKSLRSCEMRSFKIDETYSCSSSSIQSLILQDCDPSHLVYLFHHLPQMIFLKIGLCWTKFSTLLNPFDSTTAFVHPNLKSLDISMYNLDSSNNAINDDRCDVVTALLARISPDKRIRFRLTLFGMSNFNFEQLQNNVLELKFFCFSCDLFYFLKSHRLPDFDRIRQLPLFNRLHSIYTNTDRGIVYHST